MNRVLRDVKDLIRRSGGESITIRNGGRHVRVEFVNPAGEQHSVPIRPGHTKRYEDCLRSELRRRGLTL